MKTLLSFFHARPWLLVVLAFLILIAAWSTLITLSRKVPSSRLTAEEETRLLERGAAR